MGGRRGRGGEGGGREGEGEGKKRRGRGSINGYILSTLACPPKESTNAGTVHGYNRVIVIIESVRKSACDHMINDHITKLLVTLLNCRRLCWLVKHPE